MPIGKVWVYRLLFVCLFVCKLVCVCVCTVTDFSAEDKASGVTFCTAVHRRPRDGISHFCEFCSPRSKKSDESACVDIRQSPKTDVLVKTAFKTYLYLCTKNIY